MATSLPARNGVLYGRDAELARIAEFLAPSPEGAASRACGVVLTGEMGIGKTSVWEAAVDLARSQGYAVLPTRASQVEANVSFAGLSDLVDHVGDEVLGLLPPPQRHALDVALRRAEPVATPLDPLGISAGFLGALRALSQRGPVLVAIDDAQWLDESSVAPVLFALRRLDADPVRLLVSRRPGRRSSIERALADDRKETIEIAGLSLGATSLLLSERLGLELGRRGLRLLYDTAKGNPLLICELGRTLVGRDPAEVPTELAVPHVVEDIFGDRIQELSPDARRAVLAVSLSAGLSIDALATLVDRSAVEEAVAAELLVPDGSSFRMITSVRCARPRPPGMPRISSRPSQVVDAESAGLWESGPDGLLGERGSGTRSSVSSSPTFRGSTTT